MEGFDEYTAKIRAENERDAENMSKIVGEIYKGPIFTLKDLRRDLGVFFYIVATVFIGACLTCVAMLIAICIAIFNLLGVL